MKLLKKLVALFATTAILATGAHPLTLAQAEANDNSISSGSRIFKEDGTLHIELAWKNDIDNPPLVVVADYDEGGRLKLAHRVDARDGYCKIDTGIVPGGTETKLFVWDGKTHEPIYDTAIYTEPLDYQFPASEYVPQPYRTAGKRFSQGGGILLDTLGTAEVSTKAELYVNGARYYGEGIITDDILDKFLSNAQGSIRLEKSDSASSKYDRIYADYYEVAKVASVSYKSGLTTIKLSVVNNFPDNYALRFPPESTIEIDDSYIENGKASITVEKNGQKTELKYLQRGDVIAFAIDFNGMYDGAYSTKIINPDSIKVLATDKTITGTVTAIDDYYRAYSIDDTAYKFVGFTGDDLKLGTTYELQLDPFGRILDEGVAITSGVKYAIVERYNEITGQVHLLLSDGTTATYEVHNASEISTDALPAFIKTNGMMNPVEERVVTYKESNGTVRLSVAQGRVNIINKEYNPNTGKLGSVAITDSLSVIDASAYLEESSPKVTDYKVFDVDDFTKDVEYSGYAFRSGDIYEFMILTSKGADFTRDSRFAVIIRGPSNMMFDGEVYMGVQALYEGETIRLYGDSNLLRDTSEGDVIYFITDEDGFLESIYKIYDRDTGINTALSAFMSMPNGAFKASDWSFDFAMSPADIQLVSGYVTEVTRNSITLGVEKDSVINGNIYEKADGSEGIFTFGISDDCNAYIFDEAYDVSQNHKKYSIVDASSITPSKLVEKLDENGDIIDGVYDAEASTLNDAIAMIVDGEVVCIFVNDPL